MEGYKLNLSTSEAINLREVLDSAAGYHSSIARLHRGFVRRGLVRHECMAEWHEDKARICEELAYRVSLVLGD